MRGRNKRSPEQRAAEREWKTAADEATSVPAPMFSDVIKCPTDGCPCWVGIKTGQSSGTCDCGATVRP